MEFHENSVSFLLPRWWRMSFVITALFLPPLLVVLVLCVCFFAGDLHPQGRLMLLLLLHVIIVAINLLVIMSQRCISMYNSSSYLVPLFFFSC